MRNCPFCKKSTSESSETCLHCHRILIERVQRYSSYDHQSYSSKQSKKNSILTDLKRHFIQFINRSITLASKTFKKYMWLIILVILILIGSLNKGSSRINPSPVSVLPNTVEITITPTIAAKDPKDYVSLPNGTLLSKNPYYFDGLGKLEIDNGTSSDAIAKLVNKSTNKSVVTLYIKANNNFTISNISNGNYKLYFNLGNDWNTNVKAFSINSGYEVFEDSFDFTTTEYIESTEYSAFTVTLNPVINGRAITNEINAAEFGSY